MPRIDGKSESLRPFVFCFPFIFTLKTTFKLRGTKVRRKRERNRKGGTKTDKEREKRI